MLFNSVAYLIFLPAVIIIHFLFPKKFQWLWLLICSVYFYYTLLPWYLPLFFVLILINFYFGFLIQNSKNKKQRIFNLALFTNLVTLSFFKYFGFLDVFISAFFTYTKVDTFRNIILPIGLSYFIFTLISYLIEIKRGTINAETHIGIFASSLLFFPKILQGPIERPGNIFPQFKEEKSFSYTMAVEGLKLMVWGYFKKLVIADRLSIYVDAVFENHSHHNGTTLLVASVFYSFQIYADFSGYTDIALGSAKILGFHLTNNFKRPFFSISIKEFWSRWHISFSSWLRDYLFLPLAYFLSRHFKREKYLHLSAEKWIYLVATIVTFALCGIWHGEGVNFLLWGLLLGTYLTYSNWTAKPNRLLRQKLHISKLSIFYRVYKIIIVFILVSFAFIFFRSPDFHTASEIIRKIVSQHGQLFIGQRQQFLLAIAGISMLVFTEIYQEFYSHAHLPYNGKNWVKEQLVYATIIILIIMIGVFDGGQFIYFKF